MDFKEIAVEEDAYDQNSLEDLVASDAAANDGDEGTPENQQGDEGDKPAEDPAKKAETQGPAKDAGDDKGKQQEDTPTSKPNTSRTPDYAKQRKIESIAYENRELKRRIKFLEEKQKEMQPTDEDKKREKEFLDMLRDTDPDRYQEELLRINNRDLKRDVMADLEKRQQPTLEEDVNANAAAYHESLSLVEQQIVSTCPHAVDENGQPNQEFWRGENGFWSGVKRAFANEAQFLDAAKNNPGIITMIAENANSNIERQHHSRQTAETNRKGRISGQASSQAKSTPAEGHGLNADQKKWCKAHNVSESEYAKYIGRQK